MWVSGQVVKLGHNVSTDDIIPGRYCDAFDEDRLAEHVFESMPGDTRHRLGPGCLLVAGRNFGCGSAREHAPLALRGAGVTGVVAIDFARIFFRNAVNVGLPALTCPDFVHAAEDGAFASVDVSSQRLRIGDRSFDANPLPELVTAIRDAGGLVPWVRQLTVPSHDSPGTPPK